MTGGALGGDFRPFLVRLPWVLLGRCEGSATMCSLPSTDRRPSRLSWLLPG